MSYIPGGLTDDELRATPVPVDGPLTDAELRASAVPVSGPLTDAELRASEVPVLATLAADSLLGCGDLKKDAWGVQKVSLPFSIFHGMWSYDIPPSMWFMYENGTQVYTSTNIVSSSGMASLTADATNTTVLMESRVCPRYQPNRGILFSASLVLPNKTNDGVRDFGIFTTENGVFFRLKSDGLLYAVRRSNSVEVAEELIDTSGLTGFDVEKNNIYDIQFQWRSAGNYKFFIGDPSTGNSKLVHTFDLLGTLTGASIENPALPISFKCTRTTQDVNMLVGCADVTAENGLADRAQYKSTYAENVSVNGTDIPVLVIYNPLQINSQTNTRTIQLARITVACDKKATFKVWLTRDPTTLTGGTLVAIGGGSYVQTDSPNKVAGAVRYTGATTTTWENITAFPVQASVLVFVDNPLVEKIDFPIVRGDYLVVTCTAVSANADAVMEWGSQI